MRAFKPWFIYFTLEGARERLKCGTEKIVKLFAELDNEKGIGLIETVRQGLGKPNIIYVKNFMDDTSLYTSITESLELRYNDKE